MLGNWKIPMKTCSLCKISTEANGLSLVYFGEWMEKKDVIVHYYCLLLSTHLPQRGGDHSGILGFLLRDIRQEIALAKNRKCKYCFGPNATIHCSGSCGEYFHMTCGHTSRCLSQFVGEFKSYCQSCLPIDKFQMDLFARKPPQANELCFICAQVMGANPRGCIYAKCCGNGYAHSKCMKIYALSAGYYLTCIWCKDKSFREDVKYQGVFVPDREANWEMEKGAYKELYRRHQRCDMEVCNCPKGRDYISAHKWPLIICKYCGAFGAHNPACIPGFEDSKTKIQEFKCDDCSITEQTVHHKTIIGTAAHHDFLDTSLYVNKEITNDEAARQTITTTLSQTLSTNNSSSDSTISQETVVNVNLLKRNDFIVNNSKCNNDMEIISAGIYTLTQSQASSQQLEVREKDDVDMLSEDTADDSEDNAIADLLVQQLLDIFEVKD